MSTPEPPAPPGQRQKRMIPLHTRVILWYLQQRTLNRLAIWALLASIPFAIVAFKLARPAYRDWKQRNALALADSYIKRNDLKGASLAFRRAIQANPKNPRVWKQLGVFLQNAKSPEAVTVWELAAGLEPSVFSHRYNAARSALAVGNWQRARSNLDALPKSEWHSTDYLLISSEAFTAGRQPDKAESDLETLLKTDPGNAEAAFRLDQVRMGSPDPEKSRDAGVRMRERANTEGPYMTQALRQLGMAEARRGEYLLAASDAQILRHRRDAVVNDQILFLDLEFATSSFTLPISIKEIRKRGLENPQDLMPIVNYLINRGLAADTLAWIERLPPADLEKPSVRQAAIELALANRDWTKAYEMLGAGPDAIPKDKLARIESAHRAFREDKPDALSKWSEVLSDARGNLYLLAVIERLTSAWGWPEAREKTLWAIGSEVPSNPMVWKELSPLALKQGNTPALAQILGSLMAAEPSNREARSLWLCVQFLLDRGDKNELLRIAKADADSGGDAKLQFIYAALLAREGRTQEALAICGKIPPDGRKDPRVAIYLAYVYAKAKQPEVAKSLLAGVDPAKSVLLPEEVALIVRAQDLAAGRPEISSSANLSKIIDQSRANQVLKSIQGERSDAASTDSNSLFETLKKQSAEEKGSDEQLKKLRQEIQNSTKGKPAQ
ncbi:MAG: hypothetical protein PHC88_10150 [Terrimicrobiaceae bacterium]|nr:hypothetical protein [Terrimicrobiaceae bacterium]